MLSWKPFPRKNRPTAAIAEPRHCTKLSRGRIARVEDEPEIYRRTVADSTRFVGESPTASGPAPLGLRSRDEKEREPPPAPRRPRARRGRPMSDRHDIPGLIDQLAAI